MAASSKAAQRVSSPSTGGAPPSGYEKGGKEEIHGWYQPAIGVIVHGQIVGHIVTKSKHGERDNILVKLLEPTIGYTKEEKDGKQLDAGEVIGVPITYDLLGALEFVSNKGNIWFRAKEKKILSGVNSMWCYEQYYKGIKAPLDPVVSTQEDDAPPF